MSDTNIVYKSTRPDFSINVLRSTSTNRGYHETRFEIVSRHPINEDGLKHLDACGLLGIGQAYHLESTEEIAEPGLPTMISKRTGEVVPGPAIDWAGREVTNIYMYTFYRYVVLRICDSGD